MTDRIVVNDLRVRARVGVTDEERASSQELIVNLELVCDLRAAGQSDRLDDTIDYGWVVGEVAALAEKGERRLLETLAEEIAARIAALEGIVAVTVEVLKVAVPVSQNVGPTGVRIERP